MLTLTEGGSWASSLGISALTAAATSTVLVPGWRWIAWVIERAPLYHDATRLFCTSSSTLPTSDRNQRRDRRGDFDGVGAGLALDRVGDRAGAVVPRRHAVVLYVVQHLAHVGEADRGPIPVGDDQLPEFRRGMELAVRLDGVGPVGTPEHAARQVDVAVADRRGHFVHAEAPAGEGAGIELNPGRVFL